MHKMKLKIQELEANNSHLFVTGKVNGKRCRILIDTGASRTVLNRGFVTGFKPAIALKEHKQPGSGLGTNTMKIETAQLKTFSIGTKEIKNYEAAVLDLTHVNAAYKKHKLPPVHIILGNDIMTAHNAVIDYGKKTFVLE